MQKEIQAALKAEADKRAKAKKDKEEAEAQKEAEAKQLEELTGVRAIGTSSFLTFLRDCSASVRASIRRRRKPNSL